VAAVAGAALAQQTQPSSDKLIDELFGERISRAKSTPTDEDNIELARQLLVAATDVTSPEGLRLSLARTGYDLLWQLGSQESVQLAERALGITNSIEAMGPLELARCRRDLADWRYRRARVDRDQRDALPALALNSVRACLAFVQLALDQPDQLGEAEAALRTAKPLILAHRFEEQSQAATELEGKVRAARARLMKLQDAMARLSNARQSNDQRQIQITATAVGNLHLEAGDIAQAATFLAEAKDERAELLKVAAEFLKTDKVDGETAIPAAEMLLSQAKTIADPQGARRAAEVSRAMLETLLAGNPPEVAAAKAKLLLVELRLLLGDTDADRFRNALARDYGGLAGKMTVLDEENVRIVYDFSDPQQLRDWSTNGGQWQVIKEKLGCKTAQGGQGRAHNKFRFRADKPFKFSFQGSARHDLTLMLLAYPWKHDNHEHECRFRLRDNGLFVQGIDGNWRGERGRLEEGETYTMQVVGDGKGTVTWSINGKEVNRRELARVTNHADRSSLVLAIYTERSDQSPTAFDQVEIEGSILPSPKWEPPAAQPAPRRRPR
jgi:hypothetical protein